MFRHEAEGFQARLINLVCTSEGEQRDAYVAQLNYINYVLPYTKVCDFDVLEDNLLQACKGIMAIESYYDANNFDLTINSAVAHSNFSVIRTMYRYANSELLCEVTNALEMLTPDNYDFTYTCYDKTTVLEYMPEIINLPAPQLIRGLPYCTTTEYHYHEYQETNNHLRTIATREELLGTNKKMFKIATPCPYYLYRVTGVSRELVTGETFTYKGIMSWTSTHEYALDFNKGNYNKVVLCMRPGVYAVSMNAQTDNFTNESEWTLPPGVKFEVVQELEPLADHMGNLIAVWEVQVVDYTCDTDTTPQFPTYTGETVTSQVA